jgi:hypothetical protein
MKLVDLEEKIANDTRFYATIIAVCSVIAMLINSVTLSSSIAGAFFTFIYLMINSVFLGHIIFQEESPSFRVAFGLLVLIMLIALGAACIIVSSGFFPVRFDTETTIIVLASITAGVSFVNHIRKRTESRSKVQAPD